MDKKRKAFAFREKIEIIHATISCDMLWTYDEGDIC
jgi:hypothetical protein